MIAPSMIYHYTTNLGLIGIVAHRELWASDCQYLNDGAELSYARDLYFAEIEKQGLPPPEDGEGRPVAGPSLENFRIFIACFCEDGDLLSQWRGYGADQGYALGFGIEPLRALSIGEITPVQYGIANPTDYFREELAKSGYRSGHPGISEWYASEHLLPRLARVKHPGFAEEREWRILKQMTIYDLKSPNASVRFRPSSMGPIGYLTIPFAPACLREIILGPGTHTETREAAVRDLLRYHDLEHVNVSISRVPFRR